MEMHMIKPERFHAPAPMKDERLADGAFVTELISGQYYKHLDLPNIEFWHVSNPDCFAFGQHDVSRCGGAYD